MFGDSTMEPIAQNLASMLSCVRVRTAGDRCGQLRYMGLTLKQTRWPPNDGEGPRIYGFQHRGGCMDCSSCISAEFRCDLLDLKLEYIGMEFSKDLEIQTAEYTTTQENILFKYLGNKEIDAVIINVGLHDLYSCKTEEAMQSSFKFLFSTLRKRFPGVDIIWLESNSVREDFLPGDFKSISTNSRMKTLMNIARKLSQEYEFHFVPIFNVTTLPFMQKRFRDPMHLALDNELHFKMVAFKLLNMVPALEIPDIALSNIPVPKGTVETPNALPK